jgi:hypothetical protein
MNQTRAQRIHRGFHRIGAVLAGLILALGLIVVGVVAVEEAQRTRSNASATTNKQPTYSLSQLKTALKNAEAAGDIAAARRLALEIEKVRSTQSEASIPELKAILESPAFVNGDPETRRRMFDKSVASNSAYAMANAATQTAIRKKYGIENTSDQFDKPMSSDAPAQPSAGFSYLVAVIANIPAWVLAGFAAAAAAIYSLCRAAGWVLAGFSGD